MISSVWEIDVITQGHYLELGRGSGKWGGTQEVGLVGLCLSQLVTHFIHSVGIYWAPFI